MHKRLISLHYTSPPDIGGLELASFELAAAANRARGWRGILISGTSIDYTKLESSVNRICIPELHTAYPLNREIFLRFTRGHIHPKIAILENSIHESLANIIQSGDILVSFNCFSLPYNIALTSALRKLTQERSDFLHITWTFDLAAFEEEYRWVRRADWPWNLMWELCPRLIYAASTQPIAQAQSKMLNLDAPLIRIIPAGTNPSATLRVTDRISAACKKYDLFDSFPLLYMPAKISSRKNILKAVKTIKYLKARFPYTRLVIAGSLSPHDRHTRRKSWYIREFIKNEGLHNQIIVLGHDRRFNGTVGFEDSASMMAVCDGLLFTSRREGFLIPILEATLYKLPIFVPKQDTLVSWAKQYVLAYEEEASADQISRIIGRVFSDPRAKFKFEIRTRYSWDNIFTQYFSQSAKWSSA
jgi:glycosyltransferase involved in cell wall biosynthesis